VSTWQTAAAVGTTAVVVGQPRDTTVACLSTWLASHPAKACISSISVRHAYLPPYGYAYGQQLLLPILQLQGLRQLCLDVVWSTTDAPAAAVGHPAQQGPTAASESGLLSTAPPNLAALKALTSLTLNNLAVRACKLAGLQTLTGLGTWAAVRSRT
jgi:hypothetical protein